MEGRDEFGKNPVHESGLAKLEHGALTHATTQSIGGNSRTLKP